MGASFGWLLAMGLCCAMPAAAQADAERLEGSARPSPLLDQVFRASLGLEQLAAVAPKAAPADLAAVMTPQQKDSARAALADLEGQRAEPEARAEIAEGYRLLGFEVDALRLRTDTALPAKAQALTAAASQALVKGDNETAIRLAAEALAADPTDENAQAVLMLSQRRFVPPEKLKSLGLPEGFAPPSAGSAVEVPTDYAQPRPPTPQALTLMRQTVEARRAGDMDRTLALALDAMRADPKCAEVQELFNLVREDRAKQLGRVRQTLAFMDEALRAEKAGRWQDAVASAEKAAQSHPDPAVLRYLEGVRRRSDEAAKKPAPATDTASQKDKPNGVPPTVPIGAGVLLMSAGAFAWHRWGKQKAEELKEEAIFNAKVLAVGAGVALGAGLTAYGLYTMATAVSVTPPMMAATAGGGSMTTGGALAIKGVVLAKGAAIATTGAAALKAIYRYMTGDTDKKADGPTKTDKKEDIYRKVEFYDDKNSPLGEFDEVHLERRLFVEDKSAHGLGTPNPKTGIAKTPAEWAERQIFNKTVERIEKFKRAVGTRPTKDGSPTVPELNRIQGIRRLQFRVEANKPEIQTAVEQQIKNLSAKYPDWTFSATFGL